MATEKRLIDLDKIKPMEKGKAMGEFISKSKVVNMLIALENEFQHFKPFEGFEHAMYRKLCEVEMEIGKMPGMTFANGNNVGSKEEIDFDYGAEVE